VKKGNIQLQILSVGIKFQKTIENFIGNSHQDLDSKNHPHLQYTDKSSSLPAIETYYSTNMNCCEFAVYIELCVAEINTYKHRRHDLITA
jgi:hypothetical protein